MAYLTNEQVVKDLKLIEELCEDLGIEAQITSHVDDTKSPMLLVNLPTDLYDEDDENAEEVIHPAVIKVIQKLNEEDPFSKYLLLYSQIEFDLSDVDELAILRTINEFNRTSLMGTFFFSQEVADEQKTVQYKVCIGARDDLDFEDAIVGEALIDSGIAYDNMLTELMNLKYKK